MSWLDRITPSTRIKCSRSSSSIVCVSVDRLVEPPVLALRARDRSAPYLSVVVTVYRSEGCLIALYDTLAEVMTVLGRPYEVIFVNDFSPDKSWRVIESLCEIDSRVVGVDLRRNFGQDNAILTGLRLARGRYIAIMDDDLQHHPKFLPNLLSEIEKIGVFDSGIDSVSFPIPPRRQTIPTVVRKIGVPALLGHVHYLANRGLSLGRF